VSRRIRSLFAHVLLAVILSACAGGGGSGDAPVASVGIPTGIARFLLFPNPLVSGSDFETNTNAYAAAYYAAIDPHGQRTTLDQFKTANGFGSSSGGALEHVVVFRDVRDLGYGRRMTGRYVPGAGGIPQRIVFFAENYRVDGAGGTSRANVDAAVAQDVQWHIGTSAIEWSCHPDEAGDPDCHRYAKYYSYAPDGQRLLAVDLDGQGAKAMPGPCIACHGGRADPLEAEGSFPKVANTLLDRAGDVQGRLHMFQVDAFEWSAVPGYARADQEAMLKVFNTWVLCSYPVPVGTPDAVSPNGCVRRAAGTNEWEGAAAALIENAYGGSGLPDAGYDDSTIPPGWAVQGALYQQVVRPYCRTCHIVRGTHNADDVDFATAAKFGGYAERIKAHVFDRGNMPLALIGYNDFWQSNAPNVLAAYIDGVMGPGAARDSRGMALRPGRPIADAGPPVRMAKAGATTPLSGADSLFATSYRWEVLGSPPGGNAIIVNANSQTATFLATVTGDYTVRLTAGNGAQSSTDTARISVSAAFPDPASIRLAHVLDVLRNDPHGAGSSCAAAGCHAQGSPPGTGTGAPIVFAASDRNGSGGGEDAADLTWLLNQLRGRVNLTDTAASALLLKPTGQRHHHGGAAIDLSGGAQQTAALASFSKLYYWVLNGMPGGGVAAHPGADVVPPLNFSGTPPTAAIPLDGGRSIGAATYLWSIVAQPDALNNPASISNPAIAAPTLTVRVAGTYVMQLQVSDGAGSSDSATRTIVVTAPFAADAFATNPGGIDLAGSLNEMYDAPRTAWIPNRSRSDSVVSDLFDSLNGWASVSSGSGATAIVADNDPDVNIGNALRLVTGAPGGVAGRQKAFSGVPATFGVLVLIKLNSVGTNPADALLIQQQTSQPHNANLQMRFADAKMELFYDGAWHQVIPHGGAYYTEWWVQCLYRGSGTAYDLEIYAGTEFVGAVSNVNLPAGPPGNAGLMVIQQFGGATANRESRVALIQVGADVRPDDLTLISTAYPALASPARARLVIYNEDVSNAIVPNANLTASISRDDGTTWAPVTLAHSGVYGPGEIDPTKNINILAGEVTFTGAAGTALRYKVESTGGKYHAVQGVQMQWVY
jgi:hypothetical protein